MLIGYFYDNLKEDYLIKLDGLPKIQHNLAKKVIADKADGKGFKKVVTNFKTEYVTKNGSVYLNKTNKILKNGDLEVDNKHSFYLGRHIIRNGDRYQKISRAYPPMSEFYNLNKELFDKNNIFVDQSVTMSGCFRSNKVTLQRTMIPDEEFDCEITGLPTMEKIKNFKNPIKSAIRKLRITQLAKCEK